MDSTFKVLPEGEDFSSDVAKMIENDIEKNSLNSEVFNNLMNYYITTSDENEFHHHIILSTYLLYQAKKPVFLRALTKAFLQAYAGTNSKLDLNNDIRFDILQIPTIRKSLREFEQTTDFPKLEKDDTGEFKIEKAKELFPIMDDLMLKMMQNFAEGIVLGEIFSERLALCLHLEDKFLAHYSKHWDQLTAFAKLACRAASFSTFLRNSIHCVSSDTRGGFLFPLDQQLPGEMNAKYYTELINMEHTTKCFSKNPMKRNYVTKLHTVTNFNHTHPDYKKFRFLIFDKNHVAEVIHKFVIDDEINCFSVKVLNDLNARIKQIFEIIPTALPITMAFRPLGDCLLWNYDCDTMGRDLRSQTILSLISNNKVEVCDQHTTLLTEEVKRLLKENTIVKNLYNELLIEKKMNL
jgi:hypothetical protein